MSTIEAPIDERTSLVVQTGSIQIVEGHNHRTIDTTADDFKGLVESIKAMGVLVPLIVTPALDDDSTTADWRLVAGERRLLAARAADLASVPVIVRDASSAAADAAVENMNRTDLWPLEEANAIKAMIDRGYTQDGAAQLLGISKRKVTERMVLFSLPEKARSYFGPGEHTKAGYMPPAMLKGLVAIASKSPELCDAVAQYAYENRQFRADGWIVNRAIESSKLKIFAELMSGLDDYKLRDEGPKALRELYEQVQKAKGQNYMPSLQFGEQEIDQARAAGVLLELDGANYPICLDKKLYGQLRHQALKRELEDRLRQLKDAKMASSAQKKKAAKKVDANGDPVPPTEAELREQAYRAAARTWPESARTVNGELGAALLNGLASVKVDMNVARFFVFGLLGLPAQFNKDGKALSMGYGADQKAVSLARAGMRLCHPELVKVESTQLKSGKPGKDKVTYATDEACEAWLWKFLDGAKTPEDLFGRALVLYAASDHAVQEAVSSSQRGHTGVPRSRKDAARKAFDALVKPHVPASVKKLRAAMAKAEKARRTVPQRPDVPEGEWVGDDE